MNTPSPSELAYLERQIGEITDTIGKMARRAEDRATQTALHSCGELLCAAVADLQLAQNENDRVVFGGSAIVSEHA